ncbi:MAG: amino acid permease [Candidatus Nanopelagicales bacterium]
MAQAKPIYDLLEGLVSQKGTGGVVYQQANSEYFDKRGLQRHAGSWGLWGLGVAAVISGHFSGWNLGIGQAGWGGMLLATIIIGGSFLFMVLSISEMASALPHTGGAYSFGRTAMGPWGGYVTGFAETIEYVITTAVVGVFTGLYADAIFNDLFGISLPLWAWVGFFYLVFLAINGSGVNVSFTFAFWMAIISLGVIAFFVIVALIGGNFSFANLFDIEPTSAAGASTFLPYGFASILLALPFAIWFFLGIEELPLAAEETHSPQEAIPVGAFRGMMTLVASALIIFTLNPGVLGAQVIGESGEPLLDGLRQVFPNQAIAPLLSLFALAGLMASFQGIMFAAGRNVYSLSRAGYYPKWLSITGTKTKVPWVALVGGAVVGFALVVFLPIFSGRDGVLLAGSLLSMAVFGAVISYALQMVSYLLLKKNLPNINRPYVSPVGTAGAFIAMIIWIVVLIVLPFSPDYREPVIWLMFAFVAGLLYFALYTRKRLVLSPEEQFAMEHQK